MLLPSASCVLVLSAGSAVTMPAAVAPPISRQLQDTQRQGAVAQQQLTQVQVQAEQAAEAYNGAELRAQQAAAVGAAATAGAAAVAGRAQQADVVSAGAQAQAQQAAATSSAADAERGNMISAAHRRRRPDRCHRRMRRVHRRGPTRLVTDTAGPCRRRTPAAGPVHIHGEARGGTGRRPGGLRRCPPEPSRQVR